MLVGDWPRLLLELVADEVGSILIGLGGPPMEMVEEVVCIEDIDLSDFFLLIVGLATASEVYADPISKG